MYPTLSNLHHYLAYAVLLLVALFTAYSLWGWKSGRGFLARDKKLGLSAMLATHIQFTLGLILYFFHEKRFANIGSGLFHMTVVAIVTFTQL